MAKQTPDYTPFPTVTPSPQGLPSVHVDTPLAAFGGATAEATQRLSSTLGQVGNEMFARAEAMQQLKNESQARDMEVQVGASLGQAREEYLKNKGANATEALPVYRQNLSKIRQDTLAQAPNPMVSKMIDGAITGRIVRDLDYAGAHAANEFKRYNTQSSSSRIELAVNDTGTHWKDDILFKRNVEVIKNEVDRMGALEGWDDDTIKAKTADFVALAETRRIEAMALEDPFRARKIYKDNPAIFGKHQLQVEKFIEQQETQKGSRLIAHSLLEGTDYFDRLQKVESGGRLFAKATTSSAEGLFQFTKGTWKDIRARHPELGLPETVSQASAEQQTAAAKVFTGENKAALEKAGHDPSNPNLYLAHFLGAPGAAKFLAGMKEDPSQPATNLVSPAAAEANKTIFYNPDGTPRNAGSVYTRLTAKFASPGPLTPDSGTIWLSDALKAGSAISRELNPNNPTLEDMTLSRIKTRYDLVKNSAKQVELATYNQLFGVVLGKGDGTDRITDFEQIANNPQLYEMYNSLPGPRQKQILNQIKSNVGLDVPWSPARQKIFDRVHGMILSDNPEAFKINIDELDIPARMKGRLNSELGNKLHKLETDRDTTRALRLSEKVLHANNIVAGSDEYNEFIGAIGQRMKDYKEREKKPVPDETIREWADDLMSDVGGWFFGQARTRYEEQLGVVPGSRFGGRFGFQPPPEFKEEFTEAFKNAPGNVDKRPPTPADLARAYQYSLTHPDWKQKIGK